MALTRTQQLVEYKLGGGLFPWLRHCSTVRGMSLMKIAVEIQRTTNVVVSKETVRQWLADAEEDAQAVRSIN